MDNRNKCVECGGISFRIEEGQYVCNECNYVCEIVIEQFEDNFDLEFDEIEDDEYVEKDIYYIIKKLYKDEHLSNNIKKYVFKENDEFFITYQNVLIKFIETLITVHKFPMFIYDEIKKIWFYLLEKNIENMNVYVPFGTFSDSLKFVYEVITNKKIIDTFQNIQKDQNIYKEIKTVIEKMSLSKISYYFDIQKDYVNHIINMSSFYPKKSEIGRQYNIRLSRLYKKTSLLDNDIQNKENFQKFNQLIKSMNKNTKTDDNINNVNKKINPSYIQQNQKDTSNYFLNTIDNDISHISQRNEHFFKF